MKLLIIVLAMIATAAGALHSWYSRGLYVEAALLSEAFNLTSPVKLRVSDHYIKRGIMPNDNTAAGLPPPKSIYGTSVKRVGINRGGVLIVDFEDKIGSKAMTFTPSINPVSGLLSWNCTSDSINPSVLERLKPNCTYLPASNESKLMNAIANKDLVLVDQLLVSGAQPEAVVNGNTPLMLAAKIGELSIVKRLLAEGARVDNGALSSERRTPMMVAITSNHADVVAFLLSHGASVTQQDYRGMTAMDHAIVTDRRLGGERFILMVSARYNPQFAGNRKILDVQLPSPEERERELRNLYGEYRHAAAICHVQRLSSLLQSRGDMQAPELVAGQPLTTYIKKPVCSEVLTNHLLSKSSYQASLQAYFADQVQRCNASQIEKVLDDNADLSVLSVYHGQSHLSRAVSAGCAAVVQTMVRDQGLTGALPDDILVNAIQQAPQSSLVKLVGNLIEAGANVDGQDREGQTPLAVAIALEQPVVAKYLVDAGANVNMPTVNRSFPVIEATKKGYEHLVMQLIAKGADLNASDTLGRTALLAAVGRDRHRVVNSLIRAGANIRIRDANGIDAVLLAESRNLRQIKKLLIASNE
ncbi:ankyrin repeat domain-containing protein [Granulosicoccus antarcticus]|uniref:Actin-binding protein n=1 Tax=Granulosicoccus antarcticus IMCC3135 TaxID=1192854 RepID=A0A2Z2NV63_9GAMM|nr:ankyrin repeat domain-containing protein [Granulosicoccus antarcticus]ASJ75432.1 Actin-binding protein [Granulosicoccus antarcticus IMCC3135]